MKIFLIRHGETTSDVEDRYGGDYDDHLTEKGKQESRELAEKLKNKKIEIIYHSPRMRAVETCNIVNSILKVKTQVVNDLRERNNYGVLTGLTKTEAKEKYPGEVEKLEKEGRYHTVISSESYENLFERVGFAFKKLMNDSRYKTIAIITHGGPIRVFCREIIKAGEIKSLGDCGILEIEKKNRTLAIMESDGIILDKKA